MRIIKVSTLPLSAAEGQDLQVSSVESLTCSLMLPPSATLQTAPAYTHLLENWRVRGGSDRATPPLFSTRNKLQLSLALVFALIDSHSLAFDRWSPDDLSFSYTLNIYYSSMLLMCRRWRRHAQISLELSAAEETRLAEVVMNGPRAEAEGE